MTKRLVGTGGNFSLELPSLALSRVSATAEIPATAMPTSAYAVIPAVERMGRSRWLELLHPRGLRLAPRPSHPTHCNNPRCHSLRQGGLAHLSGTTGSSPHRSPNSAANQLVEKLAGSKSLFSARLAIVTLVIIDTLPTRTLRITRCLAF